MDEPMINIKDYVIKSRQAGIPDSKIIEELKKNKWPKDIIMTAINDVNSIIDPVPEPIEGNDTESQEPSQDNLENEKKEENVKKEPEKKQENEKEKRFCFLALFALILSLIPILGLYLGATALDQIRNKKMKGGFFAVLAMIANLAFTVFAFYIFYVIINFNNMQMEGFAKKIGELLNLIPQ